MTMLNLTSRNGPSRRHIQGSKIAKKTSNFQVLVNWEHFYEKKFSKKVPQCRKKLKGRTLWSRPVLYVTRETFLVQFLGPPGTFWRLL